MRSRTLREGSVGLLIIFGIFLIGGVALWLRGFKFGEESYQIVADFPDVNGIQIGDPVRYRGLRVGRITEIKPGSNGVDVGIEIDSSELVIPRNVTIRASSSGLIGETFIDIIPEAELSSEILSMNPIGENCDSDKILCDKVRIQGEKGITLDDLLPYTYRFSKQFGEPEFFAKLNVTVENAAVAASEVANLSRDTSSLVSELQKELANISTITQTVTDVADRTSNELVATAQKYQTTATQINELTNNVNQLIAQNKNSLATTLDSISDTSENLQTLVAKIDRTVDATNTEQLAANLETLTLNAAEASENLKTISANFNNPDSLVGIQQTLDSARVTFANAQKITSDLESITGDPAFLENVKTLVNGLSNLVSSTEQPEPKIATISAADSALASLSVFPLELTDSAKSPTTSFQLVLSVDNTSALLNSPQLLSLDPKTTINRFKYIALESEVDLATSKFQYP